MAERYFSQTQQKSIEDKILSFESKFHIQLQVAITNASDPYPALRHRLALITTFIILALIYEFTAELETGFYFFAAPVLILFFLYIPLPSFFKKLFHSPLEINRETNEKAREVFHYFGAGDHNLDTGVLVFLSLFENRCIIIVGKELAKHIEQSELDTIIQKCLQHLKKDQFQLGIEYAIDLIGEVIVSKNILQAIPKETKQLPNKIIFGDFSC